MNKEPETYEELIRKKHCVDLMSYYSISSTDIQYIYDFLEKNPTGVVSANTEKITLLLGSNIVYTINTFLLNKSIDGLTLTNQMLSIIPHYDPHSSGGSSFSGGGSSNNNNNNNNNNNR